MSSLERVRNVLGERDYSKVDSSCSLFRLPQLRPRLADPLIYRLTFDPEEAEDQDQEEDEEEGTETETETEEKWRKQLFTDDLESSRINDTDDNRMNEWSTKWNYNLSDHHSGHHVDHDNNNDEMGINETPIEPESPSKPLATIILNVSSLADEIIEAEMDSMKCLQSTKTTTTTGLTCSPSKDNGAYDDNGDDVDDGFQSLVTSMDGSSSPVMNMIVNDSDQINGNPQNHNGPNCRRKQLRSLILPTLMRSTISTETTVIGYNCPPVRTGLSCCLIS